jgi:glycosyltransferase involved in cell wall biosynthesis
MPRTRHARISAIVPAYNRAAFLGRALEDILSQDEPPGEVIVVDDGSTDDTETVAKGYGARIRYRRVPNRGAPVARNIGAALASGDWLWFCDSDDLWRPGYLSRVRNLLETKPQPAFVFGNFCLVRDNVWEPRTKFESAPAGFWGKDGALLDNGDVLYLSPFYEKILAFQPIFHSTLVVSRWLFEKIGGYDNAFARTGSEDFEFVLRCAAHGPAGAVTDAFVGIRRHPGNASANQLRNLLGEIEILQHAKRHHGPGRHLAAPIDAQIVQRSLQALELAFSARDYPLVRSLACFIKGNTAGLKPRLKAFLAGLPDEIRAPAVALLTRRAS